VVLQLNFEYLYAQCEKIALSHRHRQILWLSGEQAWCYRQLQRLKKQLLQKNSLAVFSESVLTKFFNPLAHAAICQRQILPNQCNKQLGHEYQSIVFDGYSGFNPDHLAQVCGTLTAGGVLVLITANLADWQSWDDPEIDKLWVQPYTKADVTRYFLSWLQQCLLADTQIAVFSENAAALPAKYQISVRMPVVIAKTPPANDLVTVNPLAISRQKSLVEDCCAYLLGNSSAHLVLTAQRGRGKSAALGLLIKEISAKTNSAKSFYLTSSDALAVRQVQQFCGFDLAYVTPDQLLTNSKKIDRSGLLIIDEAASISVEVLVALTDRFCQIVFCTTTQGYEGTGQGFSLRFLAYLQEQQSAYKHCCLQQPIRWAEHDPLESWLDKLTLAYSELIPIAVVDPLAPVAKDWTIHKISSKQLIDNPVKLQQLMVLLSQAHYRTSASDFRIILDSPNMHVWVAAVNQKIVAVCVVAEEGAVAHFSEDSQGMSGAELALAMYRGQRRPRGNLVPQILIAQEGYLAAQSIKVARVVRIATQSSYRRKGIAQQLIKSIQNWAVEHDHDFLAASFASNDQLLKFWQQQDFSLVRFGNQLDKITASYSALVLKPLSKKSNPLYQELRASFHFRLSFQRHRIFNREMALYQYQCKTYNAMSQEEYLSINPGYLHWCREQLDSFAHFHRPFESVGYILLFILRRSPEYWDESVLSSTSRALLQDYFINTKPLESIYAEYKLSGYKSLIKIMRNIIKEILLQFHV